MVSKFKLIAICGWLHPSRLAGACVEAMDALFQVFSVGDKFHHPASSTSHLGLSLPQTVKLPPLLEGEVAA